MPHAFSLLFHLNSRFWFSLSEVIVTSNRSWRQLGKIWPTKPREWGKLIYLDQSPNLWHIRVSLNGDHFGPLMGQGNKPRSFGGIQKLKIGEQYKIVLGGKKGTIKKNQGNVTFWSFFSLFVCVIIFAISCFLSCVIWRNQISRNES